MKIFIPPRAGAWRAAALCGLLFACQSAAAQIPKIDRNLQIVVTTITGVCVIIFTILIIKAGIEIGYHHRKIVDIWPIITGAGITGSAAVVAAMLVN